MKKLFYCCLFFTFLAQSCSSSNENEEPSYEVININDVKTLYGVWAEKAKESIISNDWIDSDDGRLTINENGTYKYEWGKVYHTEGTYTFSNKTLYCTYKDGVGEDIKEEYSFASAKGDTVIITRKREIITKEETRHKFIKVVDF